MEYKAKRMKDLRRGLCSNFLSHLHPGDTVLAKVKAGTFRLTIRKFHVLQPLVFIFSLKQVTDIHHASTFGSKFHISFAQYLGIF